MDESQVSPPGKRKFVVHNGHRNGGAKKKQPRRNGGRSDSTHHIIPSSRIREYFSQEEYQEEENVTSYPQVFHDAIHTVFGNLVSNSGEAATFLKVISEPGVRWTNKSLERVRAEIKRGKFKEEEKY